MTTIFLKFPDEATFIALCGEAEQGPEMVVDGIALSVIGTIYDYTDPENPTPVDGWHVNAHNTIPAGMEAYEVAPTPGTPLRVFG